MSFHCDKLCSGECCFHLLKALALVLRDHVTCARIPNVVRGDMFGAATSMAAHAAIDDPAKLAELMAMGLRARGFVDDTSREFTSNEWRAHARTFDVFEPYRETRVNVFVRRPNASFPGPPDLFLTLSETRAKLLAIMCTPADPSSREACDKILRGSND